MLDHVLVEAIGALRRSLEDALLERNAVEERFQMDLLAGDVSWETSYTLPGEGVPPRVQAEIAFDWPTWSQTAYRSIVVGEDPGDPPEIDVEIAVRVQRLSEPPLVSRFMAVLPAAGPGVLGEVLERGTPTVEQQLDEDAAPSQYSVEVSYSGVARLEEDVLGDRERLERELSGLGSWVASTLVRLADLDVAFVPPDADDADGRWRSGGGGPR